MSNNMKMGIAEFVGTFFMVLFGCGSVGMIGATNLTTPIAFGGIISVMIYSVGHISGAHFNPAVSLAFFVMKKINRQKLMAFVFFQFFGAITASAVLTYLAPTGELGVTHIHTTLGAGFFLEVLASFLLMFVITSVATDSRAVGEMAGLAIGSTVFLCALVIGPMTGASMNPARSFGPALLNQQWGDLWVYFVAPCIGTVLGALSYQKLKCESEQGNNHGCC